MVISKEIIDKLKLGDYTLEETRKIEEEFNLRIISFIKTFSKSVEELITEKELVTLFNSLSIDTLTAMIILKGKSIDKIFNTFLDGIDGKIYIADSYNLEQTVEEAKRESIEIYKRYINDKSIETMRILKTKYNF